MLHSRHARAALLAAALTLLAAPLPAQTYQSVFDHYRRWTPDEPALDWRKANALVAGQASHGNHANNNASRDKPAPQQQHQQQHQHHHQHRHAHPHGTAPDAAHEHPRTSAQGGPQR